MPAFAQESREQVPFSAAVVDAFTGAPIPYATVYNRQLGQGTVTNLEGGFTLRKGRDGDTIQVSFIGYATARLVLRATGMPAEVRLKQRAEQLAEAVILGDNTLLYALLASCRKNRASKEHTAKTYFTLSTKVKGQEVEQLECYYNGIYAGYEVMQLDLKAGRIRLNDMNNRYFVSTETCKAIHRQRLFTGNTYFPVNPMELNRKWLKKQYKLSLQSRYSQANGHRIYVIHCQPRKHPRGQFEATMWVDSTARQLLKVKLTGEDLTIHPFDPIWPSDTLKRVDLDITKTFAARDGKMYLKKVDFNYRLHYQYGDGVRAEVTTDAVMYAYDYTQRFELPHMEFSDGAYEDYIKINAIPYNRFFWDNMDEFKVHDAAHTGHWGQGASLDSRTMFLSNPAFERGILESPYVWWDEKRVFFRGSARGVNDLSKYESWAPAERYNLEVQFFMDLTQMRDSLHRMTGVVFDPYQSFFHYPNTPESNAFMNLYFDLMEIERQDLEARLHQPGMTVDRAKAIYKKHQQQARDVQKHFLSEVQRGTQRAPMVRWNERVKASLGIDNLALFGVYQTP